ncbi:MAG TPA: beta-phosphoglucomutase family hydrolase [Kineosporiaceae bacterium]
MATDFTDSWRPAGLLRAGLFDLDGVITRTAVVHAAAWKQMFDTFLTGYAERTGRPQPPFTDSDYARYVDGRPRFDGVRTFLASRGIELPEGSAADPVGSPTVQGLGNAKNELVLARIRDEGVEVYPGSVTFLRAVRAAGLRTAVVSSSANTLDVLRAAALEDLFDARVDGVFAARRRLAGKPAPDTFLAGAAELGCTAGEAAVFEDALAGVEAGRAGGFGLVVGIDRGDPGDDRHGRDLREHGADVVVRDLAELDVRALVSIRGRQGARS